MKLQISKTANINYLSKVVGINEFTSHPNPEVTKMKVAHVEGYSICVGIILGIISRIKSATNTFTANSTQSASANNFSSLLQDDIRIADLGGILGSAIVSAIKSILMIGGFVTIFSVILSILNNTKILTILSYFISNIFHINPDYIVGLLTGFLEFTNGLYKISTINNKMLSINLILSSFIIGFGGISVTLQVLNIISKNKLSIKTYIFGKLLHGTISALFTFLILSIPIFSLNL